MMTEASAAQRRGVKKRRPADAGDIETNRWNSAATGDQKEALVANRIGALKMAATGDQGNMQQQRTRKQDPKNTARHFVYDQQNQKERTRG
jgi:hypothetical protein